MKKRGYFFDISLSQTNFFKGIGILLIVFHNYFHWVLPSAIENEFKFDPNSIYDLYHQLIATPLESINLLFSYFGHFGVQIFILMSGYGLTRSFLKKPMGWKHFFKHRTLKIYPSFLIGIFILYLFYIIYNHATPDPDWWREISFKVLMIHTLIPNEALTINGPWWFYGLIFQLYLLFPIAYKIIQKWGSKGFILLAVISYIVIFLFHQSLLEKGILLMTNAPGHLPEFALGILLALKPNIRFKWLWTFLALIVFTLGNFYYSFYPFTFISIAFITFVLLESLTKKWSSLTGKGNLIVQYGVLSMYVFAVHGYFRPPFVELASKLKQPETTLYYGFLFFITITGVAIAAKALHQGYAAFLNWKQKQHHTNPLFIKFDQIVSKTGIQKTAYTLVSLYRFLIIILILNRLLMMIWLKTTYTADLNDLLYLISGLWRDVVFFGALLGLMAIPFIVIGLFSQKLAKITMSVTAVLMVTVHGALSYFYLDTQVPLDQVVLYYTWKESIQIITSSGGINIWSLFFTLFPSLAVIGWSVKKKKVRETKGFPALFYLLLAFIFLLNSAWMNPKPYEFSKDRHYYEAVNYVNYFIRKVQQSIKKKEKKKINLSKLEESYHHLKDKLHFFNPHYAFFHDTRYQDVLSPYFQSFDKERPNFVFILVESLGSAYSGSEAKTLSVTPFLDSLTRHSLYWPNCLSGAERTFGVLPGVFSSFTSFTDGKNNMPAHMSLLQNFDSLGYDVSFFYGGDADFNGMKQYILFNNGKLPIINTDMTVGTKSEDPHNNWGWDDKTLFKTRMKEMPLKDDKPFVDIYLTLSSHAPYTYPDKPYWENRYLQYIEQSKAPKPIKENFKKYKEPMAAVMYADDALRMLFDFYKKTPAFQNTVFVITGDHHIGVIPTRNALDKYNIPLIIYSPKLKEPKVFHSIVSHFDITPSIQAFLRTATHKKISYYAHWMGYGLSTDKTFSSEQRNIFVRNSRDINELIYDSLYLSNNRLFKIKKNLELEPYNNKNVQKELVQTLENTKDLFHIAVQQNLIVPYKFQKDRDKITLDIHTYADFEQDSIAPSFDKKRIIQTGTIEGKRSIVMKPNMLYGPLGPDHYFDEDFRKIEVKVSFDYKINEGPRSGKRNPIVIIEFGKDKIWYKGIQLKPTDYNDLGNQVHHFAMDEIFRPDQSIKWKRLKVYLYNPDKADLIYDNIDYQILGIP